MNRDARERVLAHLRTAVRQGGFEVPEVQPLPVEKLSQEEKVAKLKGLMEAVHAEVQLVSGKDWVGKLKEVLRKRQLNGLLYASGTAVGDALEQSWESDLPPLIAYAGEVEGFKEKLFDVDASITTTRGGIAESGALILWPDQREPRLMSLVPAVHIALLEADKIHDTFLEAMASEGWQEAMPTNALLISGPSKTADIELTLTFGVHGPKELLVLVLES
jgi:L-lactate dehydrogenase complex protein LldG